MDELSNALGSVWARNLPAQEQRIAAQESAIVALLAGTLDDAARQQAAQAAHKLAGSLGSFGLDEGSRLAAALESSWLGNEDGTRDAASLAQTVAALRREVREFAPAVAAAAMSEAPETTDAPAKAVDILLVDDDEVFADFVFGALESRSRQLTWLPDGASASAAVCGPEASIRPRVVLLDIEMPGLDGFALLEQLAAQGLTRETRVIMLTQRTMLEDVVRARKLGVTDYLAKPLQAPTLIDRVTRALAA